MNKFDFSFFKKYIPEGQNIEGIIHIHFVEVISMLFLWLSLGAILPSLLYYYSDRIKSLLPFLYLEIFLILIFIKIIYEIFNWYNDVWIVTNTGVIWLNWTLLKVKTVSVEFEKMEGLEVSQGGIYDKILKKGDLIIHKFGDDNLTLPNAINPYKAVNLIEEISKNAEVPDEEENKFKLIIEALGGVVGDYLGNKVALDDKEKQLQEFLDEYKNIQGTINLR